MKVVLFCGGLGMRMRDGVSSGPKPMAMIGERPMLWHVMRYYAHFGHSDFVLCLGYGASYVKDFFLNYDETRSNDFVLERGDRNAKLFKTDISDWRITFVDTGLSSPIGERLRRVQRFVADEPMFLANYADVLTNAPLPEMIARFEASSAVASLLAVPLQSSHHVVDIGDDGLITKVTPMQDLRQWENGGYFIFRPEIYQHLNEGEDLVEDALVRLVPQGRVLAYPYKGYWSPADTRQGARAPGRDVPAGQLPLDDLGPRALGSDQRGTPGPWRRARGRAGLGRSAHAAFAPGAAHGADVVRARHRRPSRRHRDRLGWPPARPGRAPAAGQVRRADRHGRTPAGGPGRGPRLHAGRGPHRRPAPAARGAAARGLGRGEGRPGGGGPVVLPDLIVAPAADDAHQDHRTIGEIVPSVFRDQLYLAYEIPKWDGDLSRPSVYVPLPGDTAQRKTELLHKCFPSQRGRDWWDDEVFLGLARLRGMECRARYAEAFRCTKSLLVPAGRGLT